MKVLYVEKKISDKRMEKLGNTKVKPSQIKMIINEDVDIYTKEGKLLLKFRKGRLKNKNAKAYWDATSHFTMTAKTKNRGSTTGSETKDIATNPAVMSSIIGYFDRYGPHQKYEFNQLNVKHPLELRETSFTRLYPKKFKKTFPLIKEIDALYKKLVPKAYKKQNKKAKETHFKVPGTAFTTITTNINFKTFIHTDKGDDEEGFGNLAVIERGKYTGAETCFPQYGIGVNVREGDILFMDVHEWHGNLPMKPEGKTKKERDEVKRMSIVCYLRTGVWKKSRKLPRSFKVKHLNKIRSLKKKYYYKTRKAFLKKKGKKHTKKDIKYKKGFTPRKG